MLNRQTSRPAHKAIDQANKTCREDQRQGEHEDQLGAPRRSAS